MSMKIRWSDKLTLQQNLRKRMPQLVREYFDEGRDALAPGTRWKQIHKFRLRTKRFRYTLETFRDLYGPGLLKRIDSLKKLQTYLGDANDYVVTSKMLENTEDMAAIREKLKEKADGKMAKLREYWTSTFDAEGAERLWIRYLSIYACRPSGRHLPAVK
jgi:CHAD domain-containing protein